MNDDATPQAFAAYPAPAVALAALQAPPFSEMHADVLFLDVASLDLDATPTWEQIDQHYHRIASRAAERSDLEEADGN